MKNIFGLNRKGSGLRLDPFFIETALVLPVFALCCCTVLKMLGAAAERSEKEQIYSSAVSCCESWCELYSATGSLEHSAEELFGKDAAEKSSVMGGYIIKANNNCRCGADAGSVEIIISEQVKECGTDSYVYGQLFTSDIHISWEGGELTEQAVFYSPYPVLINTVGEGGAAE